MKDYSKLDKRYTFKPEISEQSRQLALRNCHTRENSLTKRFEHLFAEKLHKSRSRKNSVSSDLMPTATTKSENNNKKKSLECLEAKINKTLNQALVQLEFEQDQGIDKENLFIILKYLDYATVKDEGFITKEVFRYFASDLLYYNDLKLLVCAIEGIYIPDFFSNKKVVLGAQGSAQLEIKDKESFAKLHLVMQRLFINKNQARYINRQRDLSILRA